MKIYENILRGKVKYPPYVHPDAQDLLQRLITPDLTKRLGNLVNGSADIKNHPWFAEVTWERLHRKDIDAPYVPPVKGGVGDASQFDKYPEEAEAYGQMGHDEYVLSKIRNFAFPTSATKATRGGHTSTMRRQALRPIRNSFHLGITLFRELSLFGGSSSCPFDVVLLFLMFDLYMYIWGCQTCVPCLFEFVVLTISFLADTENYSPTFKRTVTSI